MKKLGDDFDVRHKVGVIVVPSPAFKVRKNNKPTLALGAFVYGTQKEREYWSDYRIRGTASTIFVLGNTRFWYENTPAIKRRGEQRLLQEILAHEFVHYEQWRDGRPMTEVGTAVRSSSILKKVTGDGTLLRHRRDEDNIQSGKS